MSQVNQTLSKFFEDSQDYHETCEDDYFEDYNYDDEEDIEMVEVEPELGPSPLELLLNGIGSRSEGKDPLPSNSTNTNLVSDILDSLNPKPEFGPALSVRVAESFNKIPTQEVDKDARERIKEELKVPENAKLLGVPRINQEIWMVLPQGTRTTDGQHQALHQHLSRSLVGQARLADELTRLANSGILPNEEIVKLLPLLLNSATELGMAFREINSRRRKEIKEAHPAIAPLCYSSVPVTEWLFGDNIESTLRTGKKE
jgi:hypothetical protein